MRQLARWQRLASGEETGLAGEPTGVVGHDGETLGGMVRDQGIVVSVMSNISYADTFAVR